MVNIRLANENDIKNVFDLSNDDEVRKNSIHQEKISWENHKKWFFERIKNTSEPFYIAENDNGEFISQIRFNFEEKEGFVISISIQKSFRGKGLANIIIRQASEKLKSEPGAKLITAFVKKNNTASKKSFIRAGFIPSGNKIINEETYERYIFN